MRHLLTSLATIMLVALTATASGIDFINMGNNAYEQKQYKKAVEMYEQALNDGESSILRYNLGNAYYRLNDRANAILNYERALKLDPGNSDARYNLKFVRDKAKIDESNGSNYLWGKITNWISRFSSNTWAVMAIIFFVIMLAAIACYRIAGSVAMQKTGFFGAIVMALLTIISACNAFYMYNRCTDSNFAIVMTDKAPVNKTPRQGEKEEAFKLPAGAKVEVIDSIGSNKNDNSGEWYKIKTVNDKTGWIKPTDIQKI